MFSFNTFHYFRMDTSEAVNVPVSVFVFHTALNLRLKLLLKLGKEMFLCL